MILSRPNLLLFFTLTLSVVHAEGDTAASIDWVADPSSDNLCPGFYSSPYSERSQGKDTSAQATNTRYDGDDQVILTGNVLISRDNFQLEADRVSFLNSTGDGDAEGNVRIRRPNTLLIGDTASLNVRTDTFDLSNSSFINYKNRLRGASDRIIGESNGDLELVDGNITFCSPGINSWDIQANRIYLNKSSGRGWAEDVIFRAKDIPIFYTPALGFPLDDRRLTGFLFPNYSLGSTSGTEITIPFYWDLAPNYDLAIRPRFMSKRGTAIGLHGRYLFEDSSLLEAKTEQLLNDKIALSDRHMSRITLSSDPSKAMVWNMAYEEASDVTYQHDLDNFADLSDKQQLNSSIEAAVRGDTWTASWMADSINVVDSTVTGSDVKFSRQPQIAASWVNHFDNWKVFAFGDATAFNRPSTGILNNDPSRGHRLSTDLKAEYPMSYRFGSLVPAALGFTRWSESAISSDTQGGSYFIFGASLDGRLNFEKTTRHGAFHEIIPRVKFLIREPNKDLNVVKFDTTDTVNATDTVSQIFLDNSVSGGDFVGDTRELALSVTSRGTNASGIETYRITGGQKIFMQDRGVTLSGNPEHTKRGPLVLEASAQLSQSFNWNTRFVSVSDGETMDTATNELKYKLSETDYFTHRIVWNSDAASRVDLYMSNQVNKDLRLLAGLQWEPRNKERVSQLTGIEYESCCWRTAIVHAFERDQVTSGSGGHSVKLQVELKGLGTLARGASSIMERLLDSYEFSEARY